MISLIMSSIDRVIVSCSLALILCWKLLNVLAMIGTIAEVLSVDFNEARSLDE